MNAPALVSVRPIVTTPVQAPLSSKTRGELTAAACGVALWVLYVGFVHTAHYLARISGFELDAHNVNIAATALVLTAAGLCFMARRRRAAASR
jgi:hypothetical protein